MGLRRGVRLVWVERGLCPGGFAYIVVGEDEAIFDGLEAAVLGVEPGFVLRESALEKGPWRAADEFLGL